MTERKLYTPRPFQPIITNHIIDVPRCGIFATMGVGKTAPTLTALEMLFLAGEDHPALVLGPLRVAKTVWSREARKWKHLSQVSVLPITGSEHERLAAIRRDASVHTCNYENLPWLVDYWGDRWPYRIVVADESTRLKSYRGSFRKHPDTGKTFLQQGGSLRARALGRVAHKYVKRFIELTGTPSPNGLKDLWGQAWFLDAGERLGRTYDAFQNRWFAYKRKPTDVKKLHENELITLPYSQQQIQDRIRDLYVTVDLADYYTLEKPFVNNIYVDLPPKARRHYNDMEKQMFTELAGEEVEAFGAAARTQKCLQLANGAAYLGSADDPGERRWAAVHDEKLEALQSCVEEANGMPQIVAYQFKSDAERILKRFGKKAVRLATDEGMAKFLDGEADIGLAHPKSLGHGVDGLQEVTNIITFFGFDWDLELRDQIIGRVGIARQMEMKRGTFINNIIARDTVDELVLDRHETKRSVQDTLLDAMKRRG